MNKKNLFAIIIFLFALAGLVYFFNFHQTKNQKVLNIYIPCGMIQPFKELIKAYESSHPFVKVEPNFDNTNVLVKLILNKEKRPEVFVSPGEKEINLLVEKGLIEEGSIKSFGRYELILITPTKSDKVNVLADLLKKTTRAIVIANPDFNSLGAYAVESLKSLGYWGNLKDRVIYTNTPIEALSLVATAKVDAGIHYNSCPFKTAVGKVPTGTIRVVSELPPDSHQIIYNYIGVLKDSQNKNLAQGFIEFMFSERGNKILSQYGLGEEVAKEEESQVESKEKPLVLVEAYYPFNEEHLSIKKYLLSLSPKYKGQIKIDCIDFRSDEGYTRWRKSGLSCGGILINGKNKFTIEIDGKTKEVEFIKTLDVFWTKQDLAAVIEKELSAAQKK